MGIEAAICCAPGAPLEIGEIVLADPLPREVRIRTAAVGLCRSDLNFIDGAYPHALPFVPGHEAAGIVEAVGSEVRTVRVGDPVVTCLSAYCGHCEFCVTGRLSLCLGNDTRRPKGMAPRIARANGETVHQLLNLSSYAAAMLIHEQACVKVNPDMPLDRAAILGCAVVTGAGAVFHAANVRPGDSVCVVGCGGVGLAAINAARIAGAGRIIAADPMPEKRALAERLGATDSIDALADDAAATVLELTRGGVDHAIEAVGRPQSAALATRMLRRGGTATILGMLPLAEGVALSAMDLLSGKKLQGALMGGNRFPVDIPRLVDFYLRGLLDLDTIIAERIPLARINDGLARLRASETARTVVTFEP
jgi:S-(hydroxymethyl)glutathione dehydrogenase/alcohol dehydrogenase